MRKRTRKASCQICKIVEPPTVEMQVEYSGKEGKVAKYWHFHCYEIEKEKRKFIEQEGKDLEDLIETIKSIHSIVTIPPKFYPFLQNLRNGTIKTKNYTKIGYKDGVKYPVIKKAYELAKSKIKYAKSTKNFNRDTLDELKYCFMIMQGKVEIARRKLEKIEIEENVYLNSDFKYSEYEVDEDKEFPMD